jgi:hypothetical protein
MSAMIMELKKSRRLAMAAMAAPTPPDPITRIFMAGILAGLATTRDADFIQLDLNLDHWGTPPQYPAIGESSWVGLGRAVDALCDLEGFEEEGRFPDADSKLEEIARIEFGIAERRLELSREFLALQYPHRISREDVEKLANSIREENGILARRFEA